jgi:hypothetical protein
VLPIIESAFALSACVSRPSGRLRPPAEGLRRTSRPLLEVLRRTAPCPRLKADRPVSSAAKALQAMMQNGNLHGVLQVLYPAFFHNRRISRPQGTWERGNQRGSDAAGANRRIIAA